MGFFIVAAIFLFLGLWLAFRNWRRKKFWVPAEAQEIARRTYTSNNMDGGKSRTDQLTLGFKDDRGRIRSFEVSTTSGFYAKNITLRVLYDPKNPRRVLIDTPENVYGWASGFIIFGICLLAFGYLSTK